MMCVPHASFPGTQGTSYVICQDLTAIRRSTSITSTLRNSSARTPKWDSLFSYRNRSVQGVPETVLRAVSLRRTIPIPWGSRGF